MKYVVVLLLLATVTVVEMGPPTNPAPLNGPHPQHHHGFHGIGHGIFQRCGGKSLNISDEHKESMKLCGAKLFHPSATVPSNLSMEVKAGFWKLPPMKTRAFDVSGQPVNSNNVTTIIRQIFPSEAASKITAAFTSCSTQYGKSLEMKHDDCASYKDFLNCFILETHKACDENWALF